MKPDMGLPIQSGGEYVRDEVFIVSFEGFIKNTCEGIIRTLCRDDEDWIERYPKLELFFSMDQDELYDNTLLYRPKELLYTLADDSVPYETVEEDYELLCKNVIFHNSKVTTFEFSLFQLLQESTIQKCYFYKESPFYQNEMDYIQSQYNDVISKIEFINGSLVEACKEIDTTSVFISDYKMMQDLVSNLTLEKLSNKLFVILNSLSNVEYLEENDTFAYTDEFASFMMKINEDENIDYAVTTMYNFALDIPDDEEE